MRCSAKLGATAKGCRGTVQRWLWGSWGAVVDPEQKVMVKQCKGKEVSAEACSNGRTRGKKSSKDVL